MSQPRQSHDPAGSGELVKIRFFFPEDDRDGGIISEGMWAFSLGDGRYRLDNIPFFIYDVSIDDIVSAEEVDGILTFRQVLSSGGHSTYRVFYRDRAIASPAALDERLAAVRTLGASTEGAKRVTAIDVPPDADLDAIYRLLDAGEAEDFWTLDEGHVVRR
jgi:hypothetical protein